MVAVVQDVEVYWVELVLVLLSMASDVALLVLVSVVVCMHRLPLGWST